MKKSIVLILALCTLIILSLPIASAEVIRDYEIKNKADARIVVEFVMNLYEGSPLIKKENLTVYFSDLRPDEYEFESRANGVVSHDGKISFTIDKYDGSPVLVDGFAFLVCHELGHFLGGEPTYQMPAKAGLSVEGQADYFAAKECMPKFLKRKASLKLESISEIQDNQVETGKGHCLNQPDQEICERTLSIGYRFLQLLSGNKRPTGWDYVTDTSFEITFNPSRVFESFITFHEKITDTGHPHKQCRLDTIIAAATGKGQPPCWYITVGRMF